MSFFHENLKLPPASKVNRHTADPAAAAAANAVLRRLPESFVIDSLSFVTVVSFSTAAAAAFAAVLPFPPSLFT